MTRFYKTGNTSGGDSRKMPHIAYIPTSTPSGRGTTVSSAPTRKRPSVLSGLWCLTAVFASAKRMRKLTANAIGGKPVGRGRSRTH